MRRVFQILIIIFIAFGLFMSFIDVNDSELDNHQMIHENSITPNSARFWNNFTYIYIKNNWTETSNYEWCSGSGTWGDPYKIENMTIDASNIPFFTRGGIRIEDSDDYFILKNITIFSSYAEEGIYLDYVENGTITECILYNNDDGVTLMYSDNNSIINNTIFSNQDTGVEALYSDFNNISLNRISDTNLRGILIQNSDSNNISHNTVRNSGIQGIRLAAAHQNFIDNNDFIHNAQCWDISPLSIDNYFVNNTCTPRPDDNGNDDDDDDTKDEPFDLIAFSTSPMGLLLIGAVVGVCVVIIIIVKKKGR